MQPCNANRRICGGGERAWEGDGDAEERRRDERERYAEQVVVVVEFSVMTIDSLAPR